MQSTKPTNLRKLKSTWLLKHIRPSILPTYCADSQSFLSKEKNIINTTKSRIVKLYLLLIIENFSTGKKNLSFCCFSEIYDGKMVKVIMMIEIIVLIIFINYKNKYHNNNQYDDDDSNIKTIAEYK